MRPCGHNCGREVLQIYIGQPAAEPKRLEEALSYIEAPASL